MCITGRAYRASVSGANVDGDSISFTVAVAGFHGVGFYSSVVTVTLRAGSGAVAAVDAVSGVPVNLTGDGGSFTLDATGTNGATFAGTLSWTCAS